MAKIRFYRSSSTAGRLGSGCLMLFALPFALIGIAAAYLTFSLLFHFFEASSWVEVPAVIEQIELVSSSAKQGASVRIDGRFTYEFEGKSYAAATIDLARSSDNLGSFQRDLFKSLNQSKKTGAKVTAFVNPANPEQAVLNRELRLTLISGYLVFAILFGGTGIGLIAGSILSIRENRIIANLEKNSPGEGWKYRQDWAAGYIRSNAGSVTAIYSALAVFILAMTTPLLVVIPGEVINKGNYLALVALVFPALGVLFVFFAIRSAAVWKRFGGARLVPAAMPLRRGKEIRATIELNSHLPPEVTQVGGTVQCLKSKSVRQRSSGKNRTSNETFTLLSESCSGRVQAGTGGSQIVFTLNLPRALPTSSLDPGPETIAWKLSVNTPLKGANLDLDFDLPVFD